MTKIIDEIVVSKPREIPNPSDLIFIPMARVSDDTQKDLLDGQIENVRKSLASLGAKYYPQFEVKMQQHSTEGYFRKDFERIKDFIEVGVEGLKANAIICHDWDRLVGRDEFGGVEIFKITLPRYCRDNNVEVYEGTKHLDLLDPVLGFKTKMSEAEAEKTRQRTSRGKFERAKMGKPTSSYPFLWDYDEDKDKAYLVPERVKIFKEVVRLYLSKKYTAKEVAKEMKKNGFYYYSHNDRLLSNKKKKTKKYVSEHLVLQLINRKVFYTGVWDDRGAITNRMTGESKIFKLEFPMIYERKPVSIIDVYEQLQAVKRERSTYNGTKINQYLLSGIIRCNSCGKRMSGAPSHNKYVTTGGETRDYVSLHYRCLDCGLYVLCKPFEKSVLEEHEHMLKDQKLFEKAVIGSKDKERKIEKEIKQKKKDNKGIRENMNAIKENFKKKLGNKLIEELNTEFDVLAQQEETINTEIKDLEDKKIHISSLRETGNRLKAIAERIIEAGLNGYSFEQKRDFLLTFYPFYHKEYCIRVKKDDGKFHWEGKGKLPETLKGIFKSGDLKDSPIETTVEVLLGRKPTKEEREILKKRGLLDKILWRDSDINKLMEVLLPCNADLTHYSGSG